MILINSIDPNTLNLLHKSQSYSYSDNITRLTNLILKQFINVKKYYEANFILMKLFGTDKAKLFLLAIAADSDNTKENVKSGFADLHFVSEDQSCNFTPMIKYNIAKEK